MVALAASEPPLMAFVSGRIHPDTKWARDAVAEVLERPSWLRPWLFEHTPASTQDVVEGYLEKVRDSDLVIWLIEIETTDAVRNEVTTAVKANRPILMFRTAQEASDTSTESLISYVGAKYDSVANETDLRRKLSLALWDEMVRAFRRAGRSPRPALIQACKARSRARCVERWLAAGVSSTTAQNLADDPSNGLLTVPLFAANRFTILRAEIGAGKSLAAERVFFDALCMAEDANTDVPVLLEAKNVTGPLEGHFDPSGPPGSSLAPGLVVIDGLDEASVDRRIDLAREARRLTLENQSLRVLVTTRHLADLSPTLDEFFVDLPHLSEEQSFGLISQISGHTVSAASFHGLPQSFLEAIRRPLFAILAGVTRQGQTLTPMAPGRLLDQLVELSLGKANAHRESADPVLRRLARVSVDRGGAAVPRADIAAYSEIAPLLRSRLVVERDGRLMFPLAILAEWFAARELELGTPAMTELADDSERLSQWLVPLQMCLSATSESRVSRLLQPLATRRPTIATRLLDQAFSRWTWSENDYQLPAWRECGGMLAEAMRAWTDGLGPLARLVAPVRGNGLLRTLGVRRNDRAGLTVSWGHSGEAGRILQLPNDFRSEAEWRHATVVWSSATHNGWAWQWTQEYLCDRIKDLLRLRALPLLEALRGEANWRTAVRIVGEPYTWRGRSISKERLTERARRYADSLAEPTANGGIGANRILEETERLISATSETYIEPPWPGPDSLSGPYAWSGYSPEALIERTRAVYTAALRAYFEAVNRWFPSFAHDLRMASRGPSRIVGVVGRSQGREEWYGGLVLDYYRERCLDVTGIKADIDLADEKEWAAFRQEIGQKFESGVIDNSTGSVLDVFDLDAAETLTYSWLESDLRNIGWA